MSGDKKYASLAVFDSAMPILLFAFTALSVTGKACVFEIGLAKDLPLFSALLKSGFVRRDQVCSFEILLFVYWFGVLLGFYAFRSLIRMRIAEKGKSKNPTGNKNLVYVLICMSIFGFVCLAMMGIWPLSPTFRYGDEFSAKKEFVLVMVTAYGLAAINGMLMVVIFPQRSHD